MAAPMAGTGRLAARRKARLLPTGRVAHGLAQRSRAVHPLPPPRLETEQRSSPPPLPPPCAVRPTRRHSAPRHCSTWGPTAASAAAAAAGPTAAAPFQIRLGRDPRRRVAGVQPAIAIPGDRDPRLRHLLAGTHTYGAGTHSCHSTPDGVWSGRRRRLSRQDRSRPHLPRGGVGSRVVGSICGRRQAASCARLCSRYGGGGKGSLDPAGGNRRAAGAPCA